MFQTHTWCTGIFISYSIGDTVVCGEPTRYTVTETAAGWLRGRCASGVSIVVKIIRGSERCRLPWVIGAFLRKKNRNRTFRLTGEERNKKSIQRNGIVLRIRTGRGGRVHELKSGKEEGEKKKVSSPFHPQDPIGNSPLLPRCNFLKIREKSFVLLQNYTLRLIRLSALKTYLQDNKLEPQGEVTCWSSLEVKELKSQKKPTCFICR